MYTQYFIGDGREQRQHWKISINCKFKKKGVGGAIVFHFRQEKWYITVNINLKELRNKSFIVYQK